MSFTEGDRRCQILAGGPINSPQLLKLSGVGPADELRALGIEVVHELSGVGIHSLECERPEPKRRADSPKRVLSAPYALACLDGKC
jgi:hypothetical protein